MSTRSFKRLSEFWTKASRDLGFQIRENFTLTLKDGSVVETVLLVEGYGAKNGMLLLTASLNPSQRDELTSIGYGYTKMYEPNSGESYEFERFRTILDDWGKSCK